MTPRSYEMLARGETVGVFQVESPGMRRALSTCARTDSRTHRAGRALSAGTDSEYPDLLRAQARPSCTDYIHPNLEPILRETYGVIVYQEQVMRAAQELSGFTLGEADLLRRAMGKKIRSEMTAQRARFVSGAIERGVEPGHAGAIFDLLERFADYGFNKKPCGGLRAGRPIRPPT